jgi:hypothetical protein
MIVCVAFAAGTAAFGRVSDADCGCEGSNIGSDC